jgi:hypothetical protein
MHLARMRVKRVTASAVHTTRLRAVRTDGGENRPVTARRSVARGTASARHGTAVQLTRGYRAPGG